MRKTTIIIFGLSCALATAALASDPAPATDSLVLPDISAPLSERDTRRFDEYFFFNKQGVDYAAALSDIRTCDSYSLGLAPLQAIPAFVPLGGELGPDHALADALTNATFMWGVVGGAIAAAAIADVSSNMQHTNLRRCMQFHGYARYGTSSSIWSKLSAGGDVAREARLAQIASGPTPNGRALAP